MPELRVGGSPRALHPSHTVARVLEAMAALLGGGGECDAESQELVAAFFDRPRHWPALNGGAPVSPEDRDRLLAAARKRARGAPLQYAVGRANFRNLTLAVDERVLIPRPETELLVDLVLRHGSRGGSAVDVGTGSGAIAIALAREGTFDRVIGVDISLDALELARANAATCGAAVEFVQTDLLDGAPVDRVTVVVSNPPYIAFDEARALPPSVRDWEPAVALFSPGTGLAHTARLVAQAASMLQDEGLLALEVDARRASLVAELVAADNRYQAVAVELDLTGRERFVLAVRRQRSTP